MSKQIPLNSDQASETKDKEGKEIESHMDQFPDSVEEFITGTCPDGTLSGKPQDETDNDRKR